MYVCTFNMTRVDSLFYSISSVVWSLTSELSHPSTPMNVTINYTLTTPDYTGDFFQMTEANVTLNPEYEVKILCHAYDTCDGIKWYDYMTQEYLKHGNYNIVAANYEENFVDMSELEASTHSRLLGRRLAEFVLGLRKNYSVPLDRVHLIGHRLGAHIAGSAGEVIYRTTGESLGRITGLDPSKLGFFEKVESGRLSPHDAKFVDNIYTKHDSLYASSGRVNFYASGHSYRCNRELLDITDGGPQIYSQSINGESFEMEKCVDNEYWNESCEKERVRVGEHLDRKTFGTFLYGSKEAGEVLCRALGVGVDDKLVEMSNTLY